MNVSGSCCALAAALLLHATAAVAFENASAMQSAEEQRAAVAAGPWQGEWRVTRNDPRLTTRAASELLVLTVLQDQGSSRAEVTWLAGRAICEDPLAEPCETVGAAGDARTAAISDGALLAVLPLSPDEADPAVLHLAPTAPGQPAVGTLLNAHGDWLYRVEAERQP